MAKNNKQPKTKKRKNMSLEELNAHAESYIQPLNATNVFKIVITPGIIFGIGGAMLFFKWYVALAFFLWGVWQGYTMVLPFVIKRQVAQKAFAERNKFVNNFAQIIGSPTKTVHVALRETIDRLDPDTDLTKRMKIALAQINAEGKDDVFLDLSKEFPEDEAFSQFIEQISITNLKGKINIETLKNLKTVHNENMIATSDFIASKNNHFSSMKVVLGLIMFIPASMMLIMGIGQYITAMSNIVSTIILALWMSLLMMQFTSYYKRIFDDSIMEVKK